MSRCLCLKINNKQCNRDASIKSEDDSRFCWQHQKCQKTLKKIEKIPIKHKKSGNIKLEQKVIPIKKRLANKSQMEAIFSKGFDLTLFSDKFKGEDTMYINEVNRWLASYLAGRGWDPRKIQVIIGKLKGDWIQSSDLQIIELGTSIQNFLDKLYSVVGAKPDIRAFTIGLSESWPEVMKRDQNRHEFSEIYLKDDDCSLSGIGEFEYYYLAGLGLTIEDNDTICERYESDEWSQHDDDPLVSKFMKGRDNYVEDDSPEGFEAFFAGLIRNPPQ